jgi:hypothetical protein
MSLGIATTASLASSWKVLEVDSVVMVLLMSIYIIST